MVQIKIAHLFGSLITVIITVVGSAIGVNTMNQNAILSNTKDIEKNRELIEQRLNYMERQQDKIIETLEKSTIYVKQ